MGLTRARLILNEHQGTMDILNPPEGGARVVFTLPVAPLPVEPDTLSD